MCIQLFTLNESFDDNSCPIMAKVLYHVHSQKIPHHVTPICHVRIHWYKIPRFWRLKLISTPIKPHVMPSWGKPLVWNVPLMEAKKMLHKFRIVLTIIGDVKMIFIKLLESSTCTSKLGLDWNVIWTKILIWYECQCMFWTSFCTWKL